MDKSERKCPFCPSIEDEIHFLLSCRTYTVLRNDLLDTVEETLKNENLERNDSKIMIKYLLGNTEIAPVVAKYLNKTLELRDFLLEDPKQLM